MIAVTFAVPQESRAFRAALRHAGRGAGYGHGNWFLGNAGQAEVLVVHTGIGRSAAEKSVRHLLEAVRPNLLISTGFAGGLDPRLRVGDVIFDPAASTAEMRPVSSIVGRILTVDAPLETAAAKAAAYAETGAHAVDMETAAIAPVCYEHRLPFLALRAISDAVSDALPFSFAESYNVQRQRPRLLAVAGRLLCSPHRLLALEKSLQAYHLAAGRISDALHFLLKSQN
jgi:adenosylhomocysteine nucleosidase